MKFCETCNNLYSLVEDKEQLKIFYECDECDIKIECNTSLLYDKNYSRKKEVQENIQKDLLKYDPTYPQINNDCPKCKNIENIYYKDSNMHMINICKKCTHTWKN